MTALWAIANSPPLNNLLLYCGIFLKRIILFYTICHLLIRIIWTILELHSNQLFSSCLKVLHSLKCTYFLIFSNTGNCTFKRFNNFSNCINCRGKMKKMEDVPWWCHVEMTSGANSKDLTRFYWINTLCKLPPLDLDWGYGKLRRAREHQAWMPAGWCVGGEGSVWLRCVWDRCAQATRPFLTPHFLSTSNKWPTLSDIAEGLIWRLRLRLAAAHSFTNSINRTEKCILQRLVHVCGGFESCHALLCISFTLSPKVTGFFDVMGYCK